MYYTGVMNRTQIHEHSDEQIMDIVRQLRVAYQLKRTLRYSTTRDFNEHNESVAEHVFGLFFLAEYFLPLEDPEKKLNIEKLHRIILFHDFGEITHGDVPYHWKTPEHQAQEEQDARAVFASLPAPLAALGEESWRTYEDRSSPEACFAYALDKIEPIFELFDPVNEKTMKRVKFTYKDHIEKKHKATENYPVLRKFIDVASKDMLARKVFWEEEQTTDSK